jgi:glutamate-1-semialdehyde 2,1-aminomutase
VSRPAATPAGGTPAREPTTDPSARLARSVAHLDTARESLARGSGSAARIRRLAATPVIATGHGSRCTDLDGNSYIDYFLAFGPLFLGHRPPGVIDAVRSFLDGDAPICGGPTVLEAQLARLICDTVPCAERVVLSTTGTEAVQHAIRIARAKTGKRTILKFDGHYHGWIEPVNVNSLGSEPVSGPPPLALVPPAADTGTPRDVLVAPFNDLRALEAMLDEYGHEIACVLMEPVPCNFGAFLPAAGYLEACRELCHAHGVLLVFDEVVTGYRLALGGAQELVGVSPDIAVFAKAIASGFTLAAVAGSADAMAPATTGSVHAGGTYNSAGPSVAAAIATISHLQTHRDAIYRHVQGLSHQLASAINHAASQAGLPLVANQVGGVLQLLWRPRTPTRNYADARTCDQTPVARLANLLLADGVLVHERGLLFVSAAHTDADLIETTAAFGRAIETLARHHHDQAAG